MKDYDGEDAINYAFSTLKNVTYQTTVWSIIYDLNNLTVDFITNTNQSRRSFSLDHFDFVCHSSTKTLDVNTSDVGNLNDKFEKYSSQENSNYVKTAFREIIFLSVAPKEFIDRLIAYPQTTQCD